MDTSGEGGLMYSEGFTLKDWEFLVPQESMDTWAVILDDPNPIHLDANAVKQVGLGNKTINQGPANIAYILNMIEENFPNSQILKMNNKMTDSVLEGDGSLGRRIKVHAVFRDVVLATPEVVRRR